jgi:hypothetical protein
MLRFVVPIVLALTLVAGCSNQGEKFRRVGSITNPYCMPDGSVVRIQFPNSNGDYEGFKGDPNNCPWQ